MKFEDNDYENLARYLAGEVSEQERIIIDSRIDSDPSFAEIMKKYKAIWNAKGIYAATYDVDSAWNHLGNEIAYAEAHINGKTPGKKSSPVHKISRSKQSAWQWLIRIAAMLMIAALSSLFVFFIMGRSVQLGESIDKYQGELREVITNKGERSNIRLRDGTQITLNSGSKISYPHEFGDPVRFVRLEGEAHFSVTQNDMPFYVYADQVVIEILGTEFNVRSFKDDDIKIAVYEGIVSVAYFDDKQEDTAILEKGDLAIVSRQRSEGLSLSRNIDLEHYFGWLDYRFTFDDAPLGEVARELSRVYGVEIKLSEPEMESLRISASFEGESIRQVLQIIQLVFDLEYEVIGDKIILSKFSTR
jgi:transmembrane sensor